MTVRMCTFWRISTKSDLANINRIFFLNYYLHKKFFISLFQFGLYCVPFTFIHFYSLMNETSIWYRRFRMHNPWWLLRYRSTLNGAAIQNSFIKNLQIFVFIRTNAALSYWPRRLAISFSSFFFVLVFFIQFFRYIHSLQTSKAHHHQSLPKPKYQLRIDLKWSNQTPFMHRKDKKRKKWMCLSWLQR